MQRSTISPEKIDERPAACVYSMYAQPSRKAIPHGRHTKRCTGRQQKALYLHAKDEKDIAPPPMYPPKICTPMYALAMYASDTTARATMKIRQDQIDEDKKMYKNVVHVYYHKDHCTIIVQAESDRT